MYAERIILETDALGHLKQQPLLPPNKAVEAIFLVLEDSGDQAARRPHPDIVGKVRILGDILDTLPESNWDLPR
ncbi:MAG: hypothetical protein CO126_08120 [Hydrogenophilales bacterium CG_4_9_14_3_um_filter_63_34]|nr:MAG: hypothetical protein COZ24_06870 [Hydrogenophilales bacterium CG_4_10_14_3_um_filter_63_21]PJB03183.1 MAG: hypothetical protein CO126_08120 [Hydrogenophilales bacterium CG_4_9_14_3_um_filter_63_34]